MSNKLIAGFMLFYLINVLLSAIMEGGGGMNTTRLSADLTSAALVVNVQNTEGFLQADYVTVDNEDIRYTNKTSTTLTVPASGRGYNNTTATTHSKGAKVFSPNSNVLNAALGFNVAATSTTIGGINFMVSTTFFFLKSVPKLVTWDFAQYRGSEWLQLIRVILAAISTGFTLYLAYTVLWALGGVAQRLFLGTP